MHSQYTSECTSAIVSIYCNCVNKIIQMDLGVTIASIPRPLPVFQSCTQIETLKSCEWPGHGHGDEVMCKFKNQIGNGYQSDERSPAAKYALITLTTITHLKIYRST